MIIENLIDLKLSVFSGQLQRQPSLAPSCSFQHRPVDSWDSDDVLDFLTENDLENVAALVQGQNYSAN